MSTATHNPSLQPIGESKGCFRLWLRFSLDATMPNYQGKLKFPLIVLEGLDLLLFYTIKDLENGLEGIDVQENRYKAFDAEGRVLNLKTTGARRGRLMVEVGRVEFGGAEDVPSHQQELASHLREHLQAIGNAAGGGHELEDLVRMCEEAHKRSI